MKTYGSVEEMRDEYARVKARLTQPENAVDDPPPPKVVRIMPKADEPQPTITVLEYKPEPNKTKIFWHEVIEVVEQETNLSAFDFMSPRRNQDLMTARMLVYALATDCCPHMSYSAIGRLAHKDHTTIMHGAPRGRQHPSYLKLKTALLSRLNQPSVDGEEAGLEVSLAPQADPLGR